MDIIFPIVFLSVRCDDIATESLRSRSNYKQFIFDDVENDSIWRSELPISIELFISLWLVWCCIQVSKIVFEVRCYGSISHYKWYSALIFQRLSQMPMVSVQCHSNDRFCPYVPEDPRVRKIRSAIFWPRQQLVRIIETLFLVVIINRFLAMKMIIHHILYSAFHFESRQIRR